jgi:hypothetical protein
MPTYKPNSVLLKAINGALDDLVFYEDAEGNLIVRKKGIRRVPPSAKQVAHHELVRLASAYGNLVKRDPALSAEYRQYCRGRMRPYHVALRDFMRPPKVSAIDPQAFTGQPGQLIRIVATDDCRVMTVQVQIRHATTGAILEQGPAGLSVVPDEWLYTTTIAIPSGTPLEVEATVTDRPGHTGIATARIGLP